jgi:FkbM family methyltransferase
VRRPRRNRFTLLFVLALIGVTVALSLLHSKGQWRANALVLKLSGQIPELTWVDVLAGMIPRRFVGKTEPLFAGLVTFHRRNPEGPCPVVWDTPLGEVWGRMEDEDLLESLFYEQLIAKAYHNETVSVAEGDVVMDVGAHLGTFVLHALERGAGLVVAVEPQPVNLVCLKQTLEKQISDGRVILVEAAVWRESGTLEFDVVEGSHGSARGSVSESGSVTVKAMTLDEIVEQLDLTQVDFIKMDIEGAEREALAGGGRTIRQFAPTMALCVYHRDDDPIVVPQRALEILPTYQVVQNKTLAYFFH